MSAARNDIPDISAAPDNSLHSTLHVAVFLGRTPRAVRNLVRRKLLTPCDNEDKRLYFRAAEIKRYVGVAALFTGGKGIPHLQKGPTPDEPTDE